MNISELLKDVGTDGQVHVLLSIIGLGKTLYICWLRTIKTYSKRQVSCKAQSSSNDILTFRLRYKTSVRMVKISMETTRKKDGLKL
jgi:hypothetical protein